MDSRFRERDSVVEQIKNALPRDCEIINPHLSDYGNRVLGVDTSGDMFALSDARLFLMTEQEWNKLGLDATRRVLEGCGIGDETIEAMILDLSNLLGKE